METCVVTYAPSHHSGNDAPPSPTTSANSSNLDNEPSTTMNSTPTITPTDTTTETKKTTINKSIISNNNSSKDMIHTPPTSPTYPRRINQLHRRLSRYPSTTLSDLIPAATAALKAEQQLKKEQEHDQEPEAVLGSSALSRALTKVRVQVKTKRLKEKYLTYEWVRLALSLPVDESIINNSQYPLPPMKKKYVDPEQLIQEQQLRGNNLLTREERDDEGNTIRMVALKSYKGRTGEIATWYEWKFDKSKFTMEQVESRVDKLRTHIQQKKQIIPDPTPKTLRRATTIHSAPTTTVI